MEKAEMEIQPPFRKIQAVEVGVFLLLILTSIGLSGLIVKPEQLTFTIVAASSILQDLALLSLILYFLWRNDEPLASVGLTFQKGWKEALLGMVLFFPLLFGIGLLERGLRAAGLPVPEEAPSFLLPDGGGQYVLAFVFLLVVAISEELVFRGYLIRRFQAVTGSGVAALCLSSFIFDLGHGYERAGGVIGIGVLGFVFGWIYLWRGSLVAPMVMHFLQNFMGIMVSPMHP
jgi:membrane protease YdiL (CAAX protease family)